jgi:hypothetical protein
MGGNIDTSSTLKIQDRGDELLTTATTWWFISWDRKNARLVDYINVLLR